ncbi:threonyl-tRNA synthetase [Ammonifex degensii KC4]|uniref:Threonine--tRNA ligase n=1 Tax=Ammonifex degensii (strain DSM 10501 / KC4) TaxID=429009 RepID=C9R8Y3_AMMDK|nr:threonine--tRNA ligase [Ammonifex degensii]ACX52762.1 threonyl-tRNA synthetase [Ammonifex degensii KC4]
MGKVILPDGEEKEFPEGATVKDVLALMPPEYQKRVLAAKVNGVLVDLSAPLPSEAKVEFLTFADSEGKEVYWHSTAHILAQAVKRLYPEAKLAIGPPTANGFYYDFDVPTPFSPEDLERIEAEMKRIIEANLPIVREEIAREEARRFFASRGEAYKVELIDELPPEVPITLYRQGEFVDLCRGPHLPSTGYVKAFKLLNVAGAYWRGDERNKMLQRIYGISFPEARELEEYLRRLEEARRRDHRRLGQELDLFSFQEEGPGFPFFHPKGMIVRNELEALWRREHYRRGYQEIRTPILLKRELWERSGHWDHYKENMYFLEIDGQPYAVKPMNCPGAILIYQQRVHSYRELPLRLAEMGLVHRHELSGVLHGLMRVRSFTQDDAHIFCREDQVKEEILGIIDLVDYFYRQVFGFPYHVELSTRPEKSMGDDHIWELATSALKEALEERGFAYKINEGEGAFYGPKIDFHLEDCLGRTWQCGTIQLDFLMPEKFDLFYIGEDGQRHRPVMLHRVIFGSLERFMAILIEHFAGAFPLWLAPVQVRILPITDRHHAYARQIYELLSRADLRVELDARNEKVSYKVREAQVQKIPYMLVIGDKEMNSGTVAVRHRSRGDLGAMTPEAFLEKVREEIRTLALE